MLLVQVHQSPFVSSTLRLPKEKTWLGFSSEQPCGGGGGQLGSERWLHSQRGAPSPGERQKTILKASARGFRVAVGP